MKITDEFLELCKTAKGGYTFRTIKLLTGRKDAPKGWKKRLIGKKIDDDVIFQIRADIERRNRRVFDRAEKHIENLENIIIKKTNKPPRTIKKKSPKQKKSYSVPKYSGDVNSPTFLQSYEWRVVRMEVLIRDGRRCACCGASPDTGAVINVDHIKPRRKYPHLALDPNNLQVLCSDCNHGKGNWDETDFRLEEPWGGLFLANKPKPNHTKQGGRGGETMEIIRNLKVPTGNILIVKGEKGKLETLSLGDYGKNVNLKADCLGLSRDIGRVEHGPLLPLTEKWVITISTQYGCSMGCRFCDVPRVGPGKNATAGDLVRQVLTGIRLHPEIKTTKRLNIHFARMGEPTWNPNVLDATKWFKTHLDPEYKIHPVVSTMMPRKNEWLKTFIHNWMRMKNRLLQGEAGLQISINSTSEEERAIMFNNNALPLSGIAKIMEGIVPSGRKITLNFALAGYEIDPSELLKYFCPDDYIIKLTPMHKTVEALKNGIETEGDYTTDYPYREAEIVLKRAGYDVLVFIASHEEDMGRITCGNAILSGTNPEVEYHET